MCASFSWHSLHAVTDIGRWLIRNYVRKLVKRESVVTCHLPRKVLATFALLTSTLFPFLLVAERFVLYLRRNSVTYITLMIDHSCKRNIVLCMNRLVGSIFWFQASTGLMFESFWLVKFVCFVFSTLNFGRAIATWRNSGALAVSKVAVILHLALELVDIFLVHSFQLDITISYQATVHGLGRLSSRGSNDGFCQLYKRCA